MVRSADLPKLGAIWEVVRGRSCTCVFVVVDDALYCLSYTPRWADAAWDGTDPRVSG